MASPENRRTRTRGQRRPERHDTRLGRARARARPGSPSWLCATAPAWCRACCCASSSPPEAWELGCALSQESCVAVTGAVQEDARSPGGYELLVEDVRLLGASVDFPIQPKEHGVEFLLDYRHLWLRSSAQRAGLRIRSEVEKGIHDFLHERDFVRIDTPILTGAIGESAGTLFETDYFGDRAFLAQTGQLYVEAACPAFRKVYCFGPTFRAEKSKTRRHLTEFWMLEPEVAFADSDDNMRLQEELVVYLVGRTLERCAGDLEVLGRDRSALERIQAPFPRVSYTEAVEIVREAGSDTRWGADLGGADETRIAEHFDRPVFVYNYPKGAKAFYMKENPDDPRTVLCNDLIAPEGYGEIIGGQPARGRPRQADGAHRRGEAARGSLRLVSGPAPLRHLPALGVRARDRALHGVDDRTPAHPRAHSLPAPDESPDALTRASAFTASQSASSSSSDISATRPPPSRASSSTRRKRASTLRLVRASALLACTPARRARLTAVKRRSPASSITSPGSPRWSATRISSSSSATLSSAPPGILPSRSRCRSAFS